MTRNGKPKEESEMTSKQASKQAVTKVQTSDTTLEGVYAFKGRGKSRAFLAALTPDTGQAGDLVALHTSYNGVNVARLVAIDSVGPLRQVAKKGEPNPVVAKWIIERCPMTPEQVAMNRQLKAQHQAEFWGSDKGAETASKIVARQTLKATERTIMAELAKMTSTPEVVAEVVSAPVAFDRAALIADLKAAGFTVGDIMAELAKMGTPVVSAPVAPVAPVVSAPVVTSRALAPRPNTKATVPSLSGGKATPSSDCPSCGKGHVRLYTHVAGVDVCNTCMNLTAAEVTGKVTKRMGTRK